MRFKASFGVPFVTFEAGLNDEKVVNIIGLYPDSEREEIFGTGRLERIALSESDHNSGQNRQRMSIIL